MAPQFSETLEGDLNTRPLENMAPPTYLDFIGPTLAFCGRQNDTNIPFIDRIQFPTLERSESPCLQMMSKRLKGVVPMLWPGRGQELSNPVPNLDDVVVEEEDVFLNTSGPFPLLAFSERVHARIDLSMRRSLIICLLGQSIGYKTLLSKIKILWQTQGAFQVFDLANDYFLVMFENKYDYEHVLTWGPWLVFGSYLIFQPWSRDFSTSEVFPAHVMVWVRIPRLPYRYYSKSLFRHNANVIEKVMKIDYNKQTGDRGHFTHLVVMISLKHPLILGVRIDGSIYSLEYEGFQRTCFICGLYGHSSESCGKGLSKDGSQVRKGLMLRNSLIKVVLCRWRIPFMVHGPLLGLDEDNCVKTIVLMEFNLRVTGLEVLALIFRMNFIPRMSPRVILPRLVSRMGSLPRIILVVLLGILCWVLLFTEMWIDHRHAAVSILDVANEKRRQRLANTGAKQVVARRAALGMAPMVFTEASQVSSSSFGCFVEPRISGIRADKVLKMANQFVHGKVRFGGSAHWVFFIVVYASPNATILNGLWFCLSNLKPGSDMAWVLGGDFNSIIRADERAGGSSGISHLFQDFTFDNGLFDDHPQFQEFLRSTWDLHLDVESNIKVFIDHDCDWNVKVFGHIGKKKKELLARLRGIDRTLRIYHSEFLVQLDMELRAELAEVLCHEESLWLQKSRVQWATFGDRNMVYFHCSTMQRRRVNFVTAFRDPSEVWCSD
ncbi:hypothetical protein GQ457_08G035530 [Hibiscus cannabinus]